MAKHKQTVFYSWQSDSSPKTNRNFIQAALSKAIKSLASKDSIHVELVLDSDTRNIAGAPKIADTIFNKIDAAAVLVADVTIVGKTPGKTAKARKLLPNPNVLVELGYALKALGDERLVLIVNTAFSRIEDLPFDLLGRRILPYILREKDLEQNAESQRVRKQVRDQLQLALENALEAILLLPPKDLNQLPAPLLILRGAKSLRDKAATTIGPTGGRISVELRDRDRVLTRDGLLITRHLTNPDHHTRQGIDLLSKTAEEMRQQAGDGAKTALLLCYEMVNAGYDAIESNSLQVDVLDGMEQAIEKTVNYIQKRSRSIGREEVEQIARTAGGTATAKLVVEAFERVKPEGVWMVEEASPSARSSVEIQEGVRLNRGYLADEFANDSSGNCIFTNCFVLVYEGKLYTSHQLFPVLNQIAEAKTPVLIVAEEIEGEVLGLLVHNNNKKRLSCVAIKAPGFDEEKKNWLKDIAIITGGELFGGFYGKKLENADLADLGMVEQVVVQKNETHIIPKAGSEDRIAIRIAQLRKQIEQTISYEREKLQERLANLIGNTAVIKIGGTTRDTQLDSKYKVASAMFSVRSALSEGCVLGGGLTYYNAGQALEHELKLKSLNQGEKAGIRAVQRALEEPIRCLLQTGRETLEEFRHHSNSHSNIGFNLATKKYENLEDAGVWDSTVVTLLAVQIAFAQAKMILETTSWETVKPDLPFL